MRTWDDYERDSPKFEALFSGRCTIDRNHKIRKGDEVSRVKLKDNPLIPIPGVACKSCVILMP